MGFFPSPIQRLLTMAHMKGCIPITSGLEDWIRCNWGRRHVRCLGGGAENGRKKKRDSELRFRELLENTYAISLLLSFTIYYMIYTRIYIYIYVVIYTYILYSHKMIVILIQIVEWYWYCYYYILMSLLLLSLSFVVHYYSLYFSFYQIWKMIDDAIFSLP